MSIPELGMWRLLIALSSFLAIAGLSLWFAMRAHGTPAVPVGDARTESPKIDTPTSLPMPLESRDELSRRRVDGNTQVENPAQDLLCEVTVLDESRTPIDGAHVEELSILFGPTQPIRILQARELGQTDREGNISLASTPSHAGGEIFLRLSAPGYQEVLYSLKPAMQSDVVLHKQIAWEVGLSFSSLPPVRGSIHAVPDDPRAMKVHGRSWRICRSTRDEAVYCVMRFPEASFGSETAHGTAKIPGVVPGMGYALRATGVGMDGGIHGSTHAIAGNVVVVELTRQPSHIIQLSPVPTSLGQAFLSCNCGQHAPFKLTIDDSGLIVVDLRRLPSESLALSGSGEDWEIAPGVSLDLSAGVAPLDGRRSVARTLEAQSQAVVHLAGGWADAADLSVCIPLDRTGSYETVDSLSTKWGFHVLRIGETIHWRGSLTIPAKFFFYHEDRFAIPVWISAIREDIVLDEVPTERIKLKPEAATSIIAELGSPGRIYWQQCIEWPDGDYMWVTTNSMSISDTDRAVVVVVGAQYRVAADLEGALAVPVNSKDVLSMRE